jgi:1-acyl-sn-glycerol-3-phosphate acyltransferase
MKYLDTEGIQNPLLQPPAGNCAAAAIRAARLVCHLFYGLMLALPFPLLGSVWRQALLRYWSRALLDILHIRLEVTGIPAQTQGSLLVANHISWLDVFVINAASPSCFVAKSEVRSWPLIGMLCRLTGTVFIERSLKRDTLRANWAITSALIQGQSVALFPEGTSTDGSQVRTFHSSLLQCAIDAGANVQPAAIRYHNGAGLRSDDACYIGDMSLVQSLLNILRSRTLHARLILLPLLDSNGKSRRSLTDEAHQSIRTALQDICMRPNHAAAQICAMPPRYVTQSSSKSAYSLLLDPLIGELKHPHHL